MSSLPAHHERARDNDLLTYLLTYFKSRLFSRDLVTPRVFTTLSDRDINSVTISPLHCHSCMGCVWCLLSIRTLASYACSTWMSVLERYIIAIDGDNDHNRMRLHCNPLSPLLHPSSNPYTHSLTQSALNSRPCSPVLSRLPNKHWEGDEPQKRPVGLQSFGNFYPPTHCLLYTSPSPRDRQKSRMPSSA